MRCGSCSADQRQRPLEKQMHFGRRYDLWRHMQTTDEKVHPGFIFAPGIAPSDARTDRVKQVFGSVAKDLGSKSSDHIALNGAPVVEVIGQGCVDAVQI